MITRLRSASVSANEPATFLADAQTLRCASGTIFGRDVVPDVWSTSAMSSAVAGAPVPNAAPSGNSSVNVPAPWSGCGTSRAIGTPSFVATSTDGGLLVFRDDEQLGAQVGEIELELVRAITGVERRRRGRRPDRQKRRRHLRPVVEHDGDAVAGADASRRERCVMCLTSVAERPVRQGHAARARSAPSHRQHRARGAPLWSVGNPSCGHGFDLKSAFLNRERPGEQARARVHGVNVRRRRLRQASELHDRADERVELDRLAAPPHPAASTSCARPPSRRPRSAGRCPRGT